MNWGYKITIVFAGFVALIVTLVVISMNQKDIHLVTDNYYEKEIAYQEQIDIEKKTDALSERPVIAYLMKDQVVQLIYPENFHNDKIKGTLHFYRPSDANKDFIVNIDADEKNKQEVLVAHLEKGLWRIKMEWLSGNEKYYIEEKLVLR